MHFYIVVLKSNKIWNFILIRISFFLAQKCWHAWFWIEICSKGRRIHLNKRIRYTLKAATFAFSLLRIFRCSSSYHLRNIVWHFLAFIWTYSLHLALLEVHWIKEGRLLLSYLVLRFRKSKDSTLCQVHLHKGWHFFAGRRL